jgi:hypothetical protein
MPIRPLPIAMLFSISYFTHRLLQVCCPTRTTVTDVPFSWPSIQLLIAASPWRFTFSKSAASMKPADCLPCVTALAIWVPLVAYAVRNLQIQSLAHYSRPAWPMSITGVC